jgi:hypothetical protein
VPKRRAGITHVEEEFTRLRLPPVTTRTSPFPILCLVLGRASAPLDFDLAPSVRHEPNPKRTRPARFWQVRFRLAYLGWGSRGRTGEVLRQRRLRRRRARRGRLAGWRSTAVFFTCRRAQARVSDGRCQSERTVRGGDPHDGKEEWMAKPKEGRLVVRGGRTRSTKSRSFFLWTRPPSITLACGDRHYRHADRQVSYELPSRYNSPSFSPKLASCCESQRREISRDNGRAGGRLKARMMERTCS